MHKHLSSAVLALSLFSVPLTAEADAGGELTLGFGVADRSTTSTGSLLGLGYDQSTGPIATLDARLFIDESGLSERPTRVRTWSPKGHTPVLQYSFDWKQLSVIAGVSF